MKWELSVKIHLEVVCEFRCNIAAYVAINENIGNIAESYYSLLGVVCEFSVNIAAYVSTNEIIGNIAGR